MYFRALLGLLVCALVVCAQNPNVARWPLNNANDNDLFVVTNRAQTNLTSAIDNVTNTLPVASTGLFPAPVIVTIDTEVIHCLAAVSGQLFGCSRAQEGTQAAAHAQNAVVFGYFSAWHFNQVAAEVKAIEANASKIPAFNDLGTLSGTPTFPVTAQIQSFKVTLNGNVTSSTLGSPITNGLLFFDVCQNALAGGFTFAWPSGFASAMPISSAAGTCSYQAFQWNGVTATRLTPGPTDGPFCGGFDQLTLICSPSGVAANTVYLNGFWLQLTPASPQTLTPVAPGARTQINSTGTTEGVGLVGTNVPTGIAAGGLNMSLVGVFGWFDGVNIRETASVAGGGTTLPSQPAGGDAVSWTGDAKFGLQDAGFLQSNVARKDVANTFLATQRLTPVAFATLAVCAAGTEGSYAAVNDNNTAVAWGSVITGSGSGAGAHVLAYCDGTNWTIAAK